MYKIRDQKKQNQFEKIEIISRSINGWRFFKQWENSIQSNQQDVIDFFLTEITRRARRGLPRRVHTRTSLAEFLEASGMRGALSATEFLIRRSKEVPSAGSGKRMVDARRLRTSGKVCFTGLVFLCFKLFVSSSSSSCSTWTLLPLELEFSAIFSWSDESAREMKKLC